MNASLTVIGACRISLLFASLLFAAASNPVGAASEPIEFATDSKVRGTVGACGAGELLTANGFEDLPDYAINFVTDANTVFTAAGQAFTFTVEFVDGDGQPVDPTDIEWCLQDESLLTIAPDGLSATVTSTGFALGSVDLVVRDRRSMIENTATIAFADLAPATVYLNSDWVGGGVRGSSLVLARNATTEQIQVGDVLVSGDKAGVLERVLAVSLTATEVVLTTEPAVLTEAFDELDISASSPAFRASIRYAEPQGRLSIHTRGADGLPRRDSFLLDGIECTTSTGATYPLQVTDGSLDWSIDTDAGGAIRISGGTLTEFNYSTTTTLTLTADTGSFALGSELNGEVTCDLPLPAFETPAVPVSVLSFALSAQPSLGVKLDGSISTPSFSLSGPKGQLVSGVTSGIRYTNVGGWEPIIDSQFDPSVAGFEADFDAEFSFALDASAFGGIGFDFVASLGRGFFSLELARVQFADINGDVTFDSQLRTPLDPMNIDYTGPEWNLAANATGTWKAELTGGGLATLLDLLDIALDVQLDDPDIFEPIALPLASSPKLGDVVLDCMPISCNLDVGGTDGIQVLVTTDGERSGQVGYLASRDGAPTLVELTTGELSLSSSLGEWAPTATTQDGDYRLYLRVESDLLSAILPYTLPTTPEHRFTVGPVAQLSVEKVELGTGTPITGGFVTSAPAGIRCGPDCQYTYTSGSLVTLTAAAGGAWQFARWATDSDACPGSTDPACEVSLTIDQVAKAEFEPLQCTSTLLFGSLWIVSCSNDTGDVLLQETAAAFENDPVIDGQAFTSLEMTSYVPTESLHSERSVYFFNAAYDDPSAPIVVQTPPKLRSKELNAYTPDSAWRRHGFFDAPFDSSYQVNNSAQISRTVYVDQLNYTVTGRDCNFPAEVFRSYRSVYVNGSLDLSQSTSEDIDPGACPVASEGAAINSHQLETSIIYQCIQQGLSYDNCPQAPL